MATVDSPMPMVCDRCGSPLGQNHMLFTFEIWPTNTGRTQSVPGRVCNGCGEKVTEALLEFAKEQGLTSMQCGAIQNEGFGAKVVTGKAKMPRLNKVAAAVAAERERRRRKEALAPVLSRVALRTAKG